MSPTPYPPGRAGHTEAGGKTRSLQTHSQASSSYINRDTAIFTLFVITSPKINFFYNSFFTIKVVVGLYLPIR